MALCAEVSIKFTRMFGQGQKKSVFIGQFVRVLVRRKLSVATLKSVWKGRQIQQTPTSSQQGNWAVGFTRYARRLVLFYAPPCNYGNKCKNAELRAEHKNGLCKNIHNNESAIALQVFGWIFSIPWLIAFFVCVAKLKGTVSVDVECD